MTQMGDNIVKKFERKVSPRRVLMECEGYREDLHLHELSVFRLATFG
jgi:hypothetical protein